MIAILRASQKEYGVQNLRAWVSNFEDFTPDGEYDIAFLTMSPALQDERDFEKFLNLAPKRVYMNWSAQRRSSLTERFVPAYARNFSNTIGKFEAFLRARGVEYGTHDFSEHRQSLRDIDDAFDDIAWHMGINGVSFEPANLRAQIEREIAEHGTGGKIIDQIHTQMRVLVF